MPTETDTFPTIARDIMRHEGWVPPVIRRDFSTGEPMWEPPDRHAACMWWLVRAAEKGECALSAAPPFTVDIFLPVFAGEDEDDISTTHPDPLTAIALAVRELVDREQMQRGLDDIKHGRVTDHDDVVREMEELDFDGDGEPDYDDD